LHILALDTPQKNDRPMKPQIVEPGNELAEFVRCYWILESAREDTPAKNTIVPDGTMKLIFHYGDAYAHHPNPAERILLPKCFLIGQLTRPYVVEPLGITGTFIVRFHPNGFLPFATIPIREMENTAVPLNTLFGKDGEEIGEQVLNAGSTTERIRLIEAFLVRRLADKGTIDSVVKSTVETILQAKGQFTVHELSQQKNINRRQLARKFSSAIGLSPKQLSKTIRIQAALKTLLAKEGISLTDLAYENEYFDQAHFIKDFKEFTGLTPKEFYGEGLKMSLIFDKI
jgi:AraC-like DNA-binding protein